MAAVTAILNPLANLVAIPFFRQDGAAFTTSLTELGLLISLVGIMPKDLLSRASLRVAAKAMVAAVVAALAVGATQEQELLFALPLALVVYGATALGLRAVAPGDLRALRALAGGPRPLGVSADPVARPIYDEVA